MDVQSRHKVQARVRQELSEITLEGTNAYEKGIAVRDFLNASPLEHSLLRHEIADIIISTLGGNPNDQRVRQFVEGLKPTYHLQELLADRYQKQKRA